MRVQNGILAALAVAVFSAGAANAQFDAYSLATPRSGNQSFVGSLGLEFSVVSNIEVTELGAFDSGQQGINGAGGLFTQIYRRTSATTGVAVSPLVGFSSADPGTLDGAYRFKPIAPLLLTAGNTYLVISFGYSSSDRNVNAGLGGGLPGPTTNTGGGLVTYGASFFSIVPNAFTATADGAPHPRYGAGNFTFRPEFNPPPVGGAPEPGTFALLGVGAIAMVGFARRKRN